MTAYADRDERLFDEAVAWHRVLDDDDADWDGYTEWLEADPRHREAFDAVALTDRIVDDHVGTLSTLVFPSEDWVDRPSRKPWLMGSIAAALALAVGVPMALRSAADVTYATADGETRHLALAGRIAIDLAPSSTLVAKAGDPNRLELASGEAYFAVVHDPARTLAIRAGDVAVSDIGTRFAMNVSPDAVLVSVADGRVTVTHGEAAPRTVSQGEQLLAARTGDTVSPVAAASVASWRTGRLIYSNAPLGVVAADISRYAKAKIVVDPAIADQRFSGVLVVGDGSKLVPTLAGVMGIAYHVDGGSIRLSAAR